jgi:dTDP-4-amino-4,6-dideoxygalactose transaminase
LIPFQRPTLPPATAIDRYLDFSREQRWFSNGGPCWRLLRDRLSDRVGAYCVPVASGTLGLMAALAAVTDEARSPRGAAALPSFTFIATAQAAIWSGLRPRLLDVDPGHWHLDPAAVEGLLDGGHDLEAMIAVSAFGTPPPAETRQRWERASRGAGVPLIVDSAAGFGAVAEDGVAIGAQGDVEVVSFHATKPFAIGEGGAVFTRDRELHERIERGVNFAFRADRSVAFGRGLNAKMSELHAATALAVLDGFDEVLDHRRRAAAAIRAEARIGSFQEGCEHSTWQFVPVALSDTEERAAVLAACGEEIETRVYYEPLDALLPAETFEAGAGLRVGPDLHRRMLCLPMANDLRVEEIESVAAVLAGGAEAGAGPIP